MNNLSKILWDSCLGASPRAVVAGCLESLADPGAFLDEIDIMSIHETMNGLEGRCASVILEHVKLAGTMEEGQFIMYDIPEDEKKDWREFLETLLMKEEKTMSDNKKYNSSLRVARDVFADSFEISATAISAIRTEEPSFYEKRGSCSQCGDGFMKDQTVHCDVLFNKDGGYSLSKPMCTECAGY